jgi:GNAT superfamily N-acetyltransferase
MTGFAIRPATAGDSRFLADMLVEAANWNVVTARPRVSVLEDPRVLRYISGWPRPGDFGVIAVDSNRTPIGASWARLFPSNAPGSGFVAPGVPELTLGVNPLWRAQGVGRALIRRLSRLAVEAGHARVSLAVERANYAQRLYVSEGFVTVSSTERSDVMVCTLR